MGTRKKSQWFGTVNVQTFGERTAGVKIDRWREVRKGLTYIVASGRYGGDVTKPEAFAVGTHA